MRYKFNTKSNFVTQKNNVVDMDPVSYYTEKKTVLFVIIDMFFFIYISVTDTSGFFNI